MKRVKRKLRDAGGLSIVEMLGATVVLVLLCLLMNTGIQLDMKSYLNETAESETQLLLSTLADALSDKLRYAVVTKAEGGDLEISVGQVEVNGEGRVTVGGQELLPDGAYRHGKYKAETVVVTPEITDDAEGNPTGCCFNITLKVQEASGGGDAIFAETGLTVRCLTPPKL